MKINQNNLNAHLFTAKNKIRPQLNAILITPTHTVATDSYKLIKIDNLDTDEKQKSRLISANTVKTIKTKEPVDTDTIQETIKDDELDPSTYPDYKQIIPNDTNKPQTSIKLSVEHMNTIFSYLKKAKVIDIILETRHSNEPIVITGKTPQDQNIKILLMPII